MRLIALALIVAAISIPALAGGMLKQGTVETGLTFSLEHRWGNQYGDPDGEGETYLDGAGDFAYFFADRFAAGLYGRGACSWLSRSPSGYFDVGPRLVWYFLVYSSGALYADGSVRYGRWSDYDYTLTEASLGNLFSINSHIGVTTGVHLRSSEFSDTIRTDWMEYEIRGGLRIYLFGGDK